MKKQEYDEYSIRGRAQADLADTKEKMKNMTRRQKAEYILMYYKWFLIIAAAVVIIAISVLVVSHRSKDYAFAADLIETNTTGFDSLMAADMSERLDINEKKEQVLIDSSITLEEVSYATIGGTEKLASELNIGMLDVCVMPEDIFSAYAAEDMYAPLSEAFSSDLLETLDEQGLLYYDGDTAVGIYLPSSSLLISEGIYDADTAPIFGVPATSERKELASVFYTYLTE